MTLNRRIAWERRGWRKREHGAVAVEFALVLPVLAMLLMGILTSGIAYSNGLGLTNAVREGSRFAATTEPATSGDWDSWATDVIARTRALQFDDPMARATICVRIWKNDTGNPAVPTPITITNPCVDGADSPVPSEGSPSSPPVAAPNSCIVAVWATRNYTINALLVSWEREMFRQSIARYERSC